MAENRYAKAAKEDQKFKGGTTFDWECNVKTHVPHHRAPHNYTLTEEILSANGADVEVLRVNIPGAERFYHGTDADRSMKKDRVVLHYTAGLLVGSMSALTIPDHSRVSVAYVLGRDGTIYKLFDDEYWAYSLGLRGGDLSTWGVSSLEIEKHSVAIEIINVGWLKKSGGNLYQGSSFDDAGNLKAGQTPYCSESESEAYVARSYRDQEYYATYTDAQYIALKQLLLYLTAKYNIPYKFIDEAKRYDKFTAKNDDWNGIVSHVNFRDDRSSAHPKDWGKWDIGPAFEWDRLLPGDGFRFPLNLNGSLVDAGELRKNSKLLAVTQENIDAYYKHVEKETKGGFFPLGENTVWHGGVHLFAPEDTPVLACADGEVIAARLEQEVKGSELFYGSRNFVLLRHRLDRQTIRELYCLWVPMMYTVKDPSITASHHGQDGFKLKAGDSFARADDPPSQRKAFSEEGTSYPVKLASVAPGLEIVRTLTVVKNDVVLRDEAKVEPGDEGVILPLVPGDVVTLVAEKQIDAFNAAKASGWFHVKLTKLSDILAITQEYKLTGDYLNFRAKAAPDDPGDAATEDDDRLGDLYAGDVLKLLDADHEGAADDRGWRHVEVKSLGAGKDVGKYTLLGGWSFREKATQDAGDVLLKLAKGDVVELVQKHSRNIGGKTYDLVKLASLAVGAQVDAFYTVKGSGAKLYEEQTGDDASVLADKTKLLILAKGEGPRVHVRIDGGSEEGWIEPGSLFTPGKADRTAAEWCKALIGQVGFVDVLDGKIAKAEFAAARQATVGAKGVILLPNKAFGAEGEHRPHLHADKIGKEGYVKFAADNMIPDGAGRPEVFKGLIGTPGTLTFTKAKLEPEQRDIPPEIVQELLAKPVYYSLYMHLNNHVEISGSNEKLKDYPWLPRTQIVSFKIDAPATLYSDGACSTEALSLIKGDTLQVVKGAAHSPPVYQVKVDALADADILNEIDVKASVTLGSTAKCVKRGLGLRSGDKLRPAHDFNDEAKVRHVEVVSLANGPAVYRVKKSGKLILHTDATAASKGISLLEGDELVIVDQHCAKNKSGQWEYVRIKKLVDGVTKKGVKFPRTSTQEYGYVLYVADLLEEISGDRYAELAKELTACGKNGYVIWKDGSSFTDVIVKRKELYKEAEKKLVGYFPFAQGKATPTIEPDERIIERLKKGEVVGFGYPGFDKDKKPIIKYPNVSAGAPLWGSGKYGPPDNRKDMIHWEIFSEENLLPKAHLPLWTEAVDTDGDYNMDCQAILDLIEKGTDHVEKDNWESIKATVMGDMKGADKVEALYQKKEVAEALRHYSCQFVIEWGIDLDAALPKLQRSEGWLAKAGIAKTAEGYQTTKTWIGGTKNRIKPLLWWDEAEAVKDETGQKQVELPGTKKLWHYNPIAFLEAYSELDLEKQKKP